MRHIAIALVAAVLGLAAGLTSFASTASAQYYYYDRGYYPPPPPPYYRERPRYYGAPGGGGWRPAYVDRHGQQTFVPRPGGRCPRGYTVQDGVCKPYRGY